MKGGMEGGVDVNVNADSKLKLYSSQFQSIVTPDCVCCMSHAAILYSTVIPSHRKPAVLRAFRVW